MYPAFGRNMQPVASHCLLANLPSATVTQFLTNNMHSYVVAFICIALRGLQFLCALVAMITATMSFPMSNTSSGNAYRLGSPESNFVLLVAYTIVEYSAALLVLVEFFPVMLRPRAVFTRATDGLLAVLALSAGIVLATSDYVQHCDNYESLVHCSNLKASTVFMLLSVAPLVGSILLTFIILEDQSPEDYCRNRAGSYRMVATPISTTLSTVENQGVVAVAG